MEEDKTKKAESVGKFLDSFNTSQSNKKSDNDFKIERINRINTPAKSNQNPDIEIEDNSYDFLKEKELQLIEFEEKNEEPKQSKTDIPEKTSVNKEKEPTTVKELKPEIRKAVSKILDSVPKEEVKKLLLEMKNDKEAVLNNRHEAFGDLNEKDKSVLKDKLDEWEVPQEISEVNASVIISWLNNTIVN